MVKIAHQYIYFVVQSNEYKLIWQSKKKIILYTGCIWLSGAHNVYY